MIPIHVHSTLELRGQPLKPSRALEPAICTVYPEPSLEKVLLLKKQTNKPVPHLAFDTRG